ncbi:MAG TPA: MarR family transcriptional regulator [Acidimicrobiales bacterium]|nr:MarR family transcriptional regulator [Acidimicrobiales bacterium]
MGSRDEGKFSAPWLLRRVNQHYRAAIASALQAAGFDDLPQPGYWALMALDGGVREAGQLVSRMGISKQAVSKLIDSLVGAHYVERGAVPADRRKVELVVTGRGMKAIAIIEAAAQETEDAFAEAIGPEAFTHLIALLERLAETREA